MYARSESALAGFRDPCIVKLAHETLSPVGAILNDKIAIKASSKVPVFHWKPSSEYPGDLILMTCH